MSHTQRQSIVTVVPCYNEAERLDAALVMELCDRTAGDVVLVDDGSTDGTRQLLDEIASRRPERVRVTHLARNRGKSEAVRAGLLAGLEHAVDIVAFCDADFAAPPGEVARVIATVTDSDDTIDVALGSRVAMLGAEITRSRVRHYLGRVFATAASLTLDMPVYDTQCGVKAFRVTPALRAAVATPFASRWAFDVELLDRLHRPDSPLQPTPLDRFREVPLREWQDMHHSKLTLGGAAQACVALFTLRRRRRRRAQGSKSSGAA